MTLSSKVIRMQKSVEMPTKTGMKLPANLVLRIPMTGKPDYLISPKNTNSSSRKLFRNKNSKTVTWHSSEERVTHKQIDFILIQKRYQPSINGSKTPVPFWWGHKQWRWTSHDDDKAEKEDQMTRIKYDLEKLKDPQVLTSFQATIGRRFAPLVPL